MSKKQLKTKNYLQIIGIEVHIELKTKSKMFCGCDANHFLVKPNTHTCPVCLGLPGSLPVPNKKAIDWCVLIGLALNCKINNYAKFDRKNYFYPDLPKGYQISQYDQPFCQNGYINVKCQMLNVKTKTQMSNLKKIRINRVHMEEDTAKLIHNSKNPNEKYTLIDFNRSGVPLVEIVTEPDIDSSDEAVLYLKNIQQIIRYLNVSDCDMEKGSMRCEINISLKKFTSEKLPNYKVEIKNINSFRFVKKAIDYEIQRQKEILLSGKTPIQETRGFDENSGKTYSQRSKEEAHDYRYFHEPDIPPIHFEIKEIEKLRNSLPEMPDVKIARYIKDYGLSGYNAKILTASKKTSYYFEEAILVIKSVINDKRVHTRYRNLVEELAKMIVNKKVDIDKFTPKQLINYLQKIKTSKVGDSGQLQAIVDQVIKENIRAVEDYKKGKQEVIGFLIGQVMKKSKGKSDVQITRKLLIEKLSQSS